MKGFRDEFDYVDYEYDDENQLPPRKPKMLVRPEHRGSTLPSPKRKTMSSSSKPNIVKRPPMVDTFLAAQVKDPDSPTRHFQRIEARITATFSGTLSSASSPSVFDNVISPINIQPYSFACSADMGKHFVTPPKVNTHNVAIPKILASFTEATDNETVDLSASGDDKSSQSVSFWDGIVDRILGTIFPSAGDDEDADDTVLLTARAKYEDFFDGLASPISLMSSQKNTTTVDIKPITRRQLPPKIRTTLLHDFLDHILGPDKDHEENDDSIAGESCIDHVQKTKQDNKKQTVQRHLLKSIDHSQSKKADGLKPFFVKLTTAQPVPSDEGISRRSRSTLHDIVDQIVARISSSASDLVPRQQSRRYNFSSTVRSKTDEEEEEEEEDCDDDDDYDDDGYDDNDSDDDDRASVTDFITEISIPGSSSVNLSTETSIDDSDTVSASVLSIGRHRKTKGPWKKANTETMAFLDEFERDVDRDDSSLCSDDSSTFSFAATSFTFD